MLNEAKLKRLAELDAAIQAAEVRSIRENKRIQALQAERNALLGVDISMAWTEDNLNQRPPLRFGI